MEQFPKHEPGPELIRKNPDVQDVPPEAFPQPGLQEIVPDAGIRRPTVPGDILDIPVDSVIDENEKKDWDRDHPTYKN